MKREKKNLLLSSMCFVCVCVSLFHKFSDIFSCFFFCSFGCHNNSSSNNNKKWFFVNYFRRNFFCLEMINVTDEMYYCVKTTTKERKKNVFSFELFTSHLFTRETDIIISREKVSFEILPSCFFLLFFWFSSVAPVISFFFSQSLCVCSFALLFVPFDTVFV